MIGDTSRPMEALSTPPVFAYFIIIILTTLRLDFRLSLFTGGMAALEYLGLLIYYRSFPMDPDSLLYPLPLHFARMFFYFLLGLLAGFIAEEIKKNTIKILHQTRERNHVLDIFGKHVSPEVVDKLLEQKRGEENEIRHVCIMFLDIRNFTAFSENKPPDEVVLYLNRLFEFMINIINRHKGIVNKFLGDGFMAVFGAPISDGQDSRNALNAAVEIIQELERQKIAGLVPDTRIGIGLHAGEAVTGNVGSPSRKEYTIIGDAVNLASRIEQLNKKFNSNLLISESVKAPLETILDSLREKYNLSETTLEEAVNVKGRNERVNVYRII